MMKKLKLLMLLIGCASFCFAQKPAVDQSVIGKWKSASTAKISNDGKYATYSVVNSIFRASPEDRCIIKQLDGKWEKSFSSRFPADFSDDNRTAIILKDTICLIKLGTSSVEKLTNILGYKFLSLANQHYLILQKATADKPLIIRNLVTNKEQLFTGVVNYMLSPDGGKMVLNFAGGKDSGGQSQLALIDLRTGKQTAIFKGFGPTNYVFNKKEDKLAFSVLERVGIGIGRAIYIYTATGGAVKTISSQSPGIDSTLAIERISNFSKDGTRLFFTVKTKPAAKQPVTGVMVDVWNYRDVKLQSSQLNQLNPVDPTLVASDNRECTAVANLATGGIIHLEKDGDQPMLFPETITDDYLFVCTGTGDAVEGYWNSGVGVCYHQIDTKTGNRKNLDLLLMGFRGLSPAGKYVIGKGRAGQDYFVQNIRTGKTVNMTGSIHLPKVNTDYSGEQPEPSEFGEIAGWTANDGAILMSDKYDIWMLDPEGIRAPVNLTGGYGRRNHIMLRIVKDYGTTPIKDTESLLLCAFNQDNKDNGFYSLQLNKPGNPTKLTMGPYLFHWKDLTAFAPLKARDANLWIVQRKSAAESANFFTTTDFKTFTPLSNAYPEKDYNWLTSELMSWKDENGKVMQGVLYKPENFDPNKKYPIIFDYYEKRSHEMNLYRSPELSRDRINIPLFVSRGYLVYTPDVYYAKGEAGKSALKAVVGAAKMLSSYPWVDTAKMGLQGHSFGGLETNYIVTHSNIFAAAMSASGVSDYISIYNVYSGPVSMQYMTEHGQLRVGGNLWENLEQYIENSAVLNADKVTTPLLLMSNKGDGNVPFTQGLEFFLSLRRLGKKAWLLQYDGEGHSLLNEAATKDYTIRMDQFFDHYLKGAPAAKWMLEGVPAAEKGIKNGLELSAEKDANGKPVTPGPGLTINN
ncbi:hypothetical protein C3K47_05165 [Solitalea longa]|uniref:Peptidase S9 prolyl oligopeptidase catalytic domain-containing protein n=1 Tax=Solitalea longa TaxID=2079460 RepID=A0A2S5A5R1_9SPHI|nr:prolyl oligopeptidase family serine peptidase [Solitalea longa]POY37918.1 hypothetical protein C3K47_05165 [Solitalea longa]